VKIDSTDWPRRSAASELEIDQLLAEGSPHHAVDDSRLLNHPAIASWVREAYCVLLELQEQPDSKKLLAQLDCVRNEFERASDAFGTVLLAEQAMLDTARKTHIDRLEQMVAARQAQVANLEQAVAQRDARLEQVVTARDALLEQLEEAASARKAQVSDLEHAVAQRDALLQQLEEAAAAQHAQVADLEQAVAQRDALVGQLEEAAAAEQALQAQTSERMREQRNKLLYRLNKLQTGAAWQLAKPFRSAEYRWPSLVRAIATLPKLAYWALTFQLRSRLGVSRQARLLLHTGLFDLPWYLEHNQDIVLNGANPVLHWLVSGWREDRDPSPLFDCSWYLDQNSDVAQAQINPLVHYVQNGACEGRDPNPLFDSDWYLDQNRDVVESQANPLAHYLRAGAREGRDPNPLFDSDWYLDQNRDVVESQANPLAHYLRVGAREGRDPNPLFDSHWYLEQNPDVAQAQINPLAHYLRGGADEGRDPSPLFDSHWYLAQNPDVAQAQLNPLVHYLRSGACEGRDPNPLFDGAWYLRQHPELAETKTNPLLHYIINGADGSISPGPRFDAGNYFTRHKGLIETGMTPLEHFLRRLQDSKPGQHAKRESQPSDSLYHQIYACYSDSARHQPSGEYYAPDSDPGLEKTDLPVRIIAFYLPQFHPIAENDEWWGKGFTEWTNVSKAVPQFEGHYQPRLPGELGFYDLRVAQVQRRQTELARQYGIYGFCYHYYWFAGRRLLERPIEQMLADSSLDFPFCICWANENWTRRWDGQENEILLAQEHSPQSDIQFIEDAAILFRDPRYIRIEGRPLLIVYRVNLLPEPRETVERWRVRCRELAVGEPYLVAAQTFGITDPRPYGFEAAVEFLPPHNTPAEDITDRVALLNPDYKGRIYSYRSVLDNVLASERSKPYPVFRCASPGWDNEPRKPGGGHIFTGATPRLYAEWIADLGRKTSARSNPNERILFVNAWNEWAEGAYLEPDRRFGYAYLRATAKILRLLAQERPPFEGPGIRWLVDEPTESGARIAVMAHVYHAERWEDLVAYLDNIAESFDLFAAVVHEDDASCVCASLPENVERCFLGVVPNRGRNIASFLAFLRIVQRLDYEIALRVNTEGTSMCNGDESWKDMLEKSLGSRAATSDILCLLRSEREIGLIAPSGHLLPAESSWGQRGEAELNLMHFARLVTEVGLPRRTRGFCFPAGPLYWFRPRALSPLAALEIEEDDVPSESGQADWTIAHALEPIVGLASSTDGWRIEVTK
jgi:lipopolysaccharide biosynthesis protein